jgi:hypothetical protein
LDTFSAFLDGSIRQANDGHTWEAGSVIDFHLYHHTVKANYRTGIDSRKHI